MLPKSENLLIESCKFSMRTFCMCLQIGYGVYFCIKNGKFGEDKTFFYIVLQLAYSEIL